MGFLGIGGAIGRGAGGVGEQLGAASEGLRKSKLDELMDAIRIQQVKLQIQKQQQEMAEFGKPQPYGTAQGPTGETLGLTYNRSTGKFETQPLIPGYDKNAVKKQADELIGTLPDDIRGVAQHLYDAHTASGNPMEGLKAVSAIADRYVTAQMKPPKTISETEQAVNDWISAHNLQNTAATRTMARIALKESERVPKTPNEQEAAIKDYIEANSLPNTAASRTKARVDLKLIEKGPSMQEYQRADLSENLNENLDQLSEIVDRRPDLFGPIAGRWTTLKEFTGSDDPDIGALGAIKDMLGRAQISAHGMRSGAQVVEAANSILNSFKNGPAAVKGAIARARNSVATFQADVQRKVGGQLPNYTPPAPEQKKKVLREGVDF